MLAAALAAGLGGCSGPRDPHIQYGPVRVLQRSSEAVQLGFELDLSNPNEQPLNLLEFRYTLWAGGRPVYEGRRAAAATLRSSGSRRQTLPAVVRFDQLSGPAPQALDCRLTGRLTYDTPGAMARTLRDIGLRRPAVGLETRAVVALGDGDGP